MDVKGRGAVRRKEKVPSGLGPISVIILALGAVIAAAYVGSLVQEDFIALFESILGAPQAAPLATGPTKPVIPANFN